MKFPTQSFSIPLSSKQVQVWVLVHPEEAAWFVQVRFNRVSQCWMMTVTPPSTKQSFTTPIFPQQRLFGPLGQAHLQILWDWLCFFPITQSKSIDAGTEPLLVLVTV